MWSPLFGTLLAWTFSVLALCLWLRRNQRRVQRWERGQCLECGYDLRATPHRCPECGRIPLDRERIKHEHLSLVELLIVITLIMVAVGMTAQWFRMQTEKLRLQQPAPRTLPAK